MQAIEFRDKLNKLIEEHGDLHLFVDNVDGFYPAAVGCVYIFDLEEFGGKGKAIYIDR